MNFFNISDVLFLIVWHFFADFILQTKWQAINKSSRTTALINHTITYSLAWFILLINFSLIQVIIFIIITFICHTITDYITSRVNKILAEEARKTNNWHNFFVGIGIDQVLHYVQLFLTYKLIATYV